MSSLRRLFGLILVVYALAAAADAHEYWIEPLQFRLAAGKDIVANLRLGEEFKGNIHPFIPQRSLGTWLVNADGTRPWGARIGDIPAVREAPGPPGLHVLAYHSTAARLSYTEAGKFADFLDKNGLAWALEEHQRRGLPETGFDEAYSRCAKALIQSGDGEGDDAVIGMPLELVAGANPYTLPPDASVLPVTLLWQGEPLADAQITVFRDRDGVGVEKVRTGPNGAASIPLGDGGRFLLNAIHIIPWDEMPADAWHSYWASLTFEIQPKR